ncbi:MAG: hypothetical protein NW215_00440 [Hyphomicrobiales bacterium]|nr:hypothetical protein [Hyphomicrobiales bacterium]
MVAGIAVAILWSSGIHAQTWDIDNTDPTGVWAVQNDKSKVQRSSSRIIRGVTPNAGRQCGTVTNSLPDRDYFIPLKDADWQNFVGKAEAGQVPGVTFTNMDCNPPANCPAGTANWADGASTCSAALVAMTHNESGEATNTAAGYTGSATVTCKNGAYQYAAASCIPNDATPDAFTFNDVTAAAASTLTTSNIVQITGINASTPTGISGGSASYRICADATCSTNPEFTTSSGAITHNQYLQLRLTSAASDSATVSTTMSVNGVTDVWSVTTVTGDTAPDAFTFAHTKNVERSTQTNSGIVQITGISAPAAISISGGGPGGYGPRGNNGPTASYRVCADRFCSTDPSFTTGGGTISNNQYLQLRTNSSSSNNTTVSTTVTVGGVTAKWDLTTGACGTRGCTANM